MNEEEIELTKSDLEIDPRKKLIEVFDFAQEEAEHTVTYIIGRFIATTLR